MGHKDHGLVPERSLDAVLEDVLSSVVVHGRQRIVQEHDIATKIGAAGEVEALALTTGQIDSAQTSLTEEKGG